LIHCPPIPPQPGTVVDEIEPLHSHPGSRGEKSMKHLITVFCLLGAIALYIAGSAREAVVLIVVGLLLEGAFWIRLFRRDGFRERNG